MSNPTSNNKLSILTLNRLYVTRNGADVHNLETTKIKNEINLQILKTHPKTRTNFKKDFNHFTEFDTNKFTFYNYEDVIDGYKVQLKFVRINNSELLTDYDITHDTSVKEVLVSDFKIRNNTVSDSELMMNKIYEEMQNNMEKHKNINLCPVDVPFLKPTTKLRIHQTANINFMIKREENPPKHRFTRNKLSFFPDGRICDISEDKIIDIKNIPEYSYKGGVIFDATGMGKTLQMLALCVLRPLNTLIIVPKHMKHQWHDQIEEHFDLQVLDHMNITIIAYDDITDKFSFDGYDRVIVDEIHELYTTKEYADKGLMNMLINIDVKYKWGVSATIFHDEEKLPMFNIFKFITNHAFNGNYLITRFKYYQSKLQQMFVRNVFGDSSGIQIPKTNIINELIDFNNEERVIYQSEQMKSNNNIDTDFLRKICCDVILKFDAKKNETLTKEDFCNTVIGHYKALVDGNKFDIQELDDTIDKITHEIEKNKYLINAIRDGSAMEADYNQLKTPAQLININSNLEKQIDNFKRKRKDVEKVLSVNERQYNYINSQFNEKNKECDICYEDLDSDEGYSSYFMGECGHYFCNECAASWFTQYKDSCPHCRRHLPEGKRYIIDNSYNKEKQLFSSKLLKLRKIIQVERKGEQFIIFTEYKDLIDKIQSFLTMNNISSKYMSGNVTNIVKDFKDKKFDCLILSSETNSSGLNLQFCHNIIIFEPIKGDYKYLQQIEEQIIGRIVRLGQEEICNVYRLIIRNSIEEILYNKNY